MSFFHRGNCNCPKRIVHPTRHRCVHCCSESTVEHVHPVHTTVVNHHLERNRHVFPQSTSVKNDNKCVDEFGGPCHTPSNQELCNKAEGCGNKMMDGGFDGYGNPNQPYPHADQHPHYHGYHPGYPPHHPDQNHPWGHPNHGEMNSWKKPNKWC